MLKAKKKYSIAFFKDHRSHAIQQKCKYKREFNKLSVHLCDCAMRVKNSSLGWRAEWILCHWILQCWIGKFKIALDAETLNFFYLTEKVHIEMMHAWIRKYWERGKNCSRQNIETIKKLCNCRIIEGRCLGNVKLINVAETLYTISSI